MLPFVGILPSCEAQNKLNLHLLFSPPGGGMIMEPPGRGGRHGGPGAGPGAGQDRLRGEAAEGIVDTVMVFIEG
mgnify:CR=1 FL=1